jgi:hypothetical protein
MKEEEKSYCAMVSSILTLFIWVLLIFDIILIKDKSLIYLVIVMSTIKMVVDGFREYRVGIAISSLVIMIEIARLLFSLV